MGLLGIWEFLQVVAGNVGLFLSFFVVSNLWLISQIFKQYFDTMIPGKEPTKQLKVPTFIKICILLCIGNLITISRIYMMDQALTAAEQYFNKSNKETEKIDNNQVPKIRKFEQMATIVTNIRLQSSYLLPITKEFGAIIAVIIPYFKNKGFLTLLILLVINFICFSTFLAFPNSFLVYRLTYVLQSAIVYPMITLSSLSVIKAAPHQLIFVKDYCACLMFFLPQSGRALSSFIFNASLQGQANSTQIMHSSILRLLTIGSFVTFFTFCVIFKSKKSIKQTFQRRLKAIIENVNNQGFEDEKNLEADKDFFQSKMKLQSEALMHSKNEALKIFDRQQIKKGSDQQKRYQKGINLLRQNLGILIMIWGITFALGNQVMDLKKQFLTDLASQDRKIEIEEALKETHIPSEVLIYTFSTVVSFIMIALIRSGKTQSLRLTSFCYMAGYLSLMVLYLMVNKLVNTNILLVNMCVIACRISFLIFLIPTLFNLEEVGISALEGINILLLINWAIQIILRVMLLIFSIEAKIFILAFVAMVCCFYIQKMDKSIKNIMEDPVGYNKIRECDMEQDLQMAALDQSLQMMKSTPKIKPIPQI